MLECVVNLSEGRRAVAVGELTEVAADAVLDVHHDPSHHRAVVTMAGTAESLEAAVRRLVATAVARLDLTTHRGIHPRHGVVDVVPFVPLGDAPPVASSADLAPAVAARDRLARFAGTELGVPCYLYGPLPDGSQRTLPDVRRALRAGGARPPEPDFGPRLAHPTAGVMAVGARPPLIAYNLWLEDSDAATARALADTIRSPAVRALGLADAHIVQVSCNLIEPWRVGPADVYDALAERLRAGRGRIGRAELVGLLPEEVLRAVPPSRWTALDLGEDRTIEARLSVRGIA